MGTLQGPVICRTIVQSRIGASLLENTSLGTKGTILGCGFRGSRGKCRVAIRVGRPCERRSMSVNCSFISSSDGNGSMAENFSERDEDYVDSSVIEAANLLPFLDLVPIQVNKRLAYSDGMKVLEPSKIEVQSPSSDGLLFAELDRPDDQPCLETKEFDLVRNMLIAAVEERYRDAALWNHKLAKLRTKRWN